MSIHDYSLIIIGRAIERVAQVRDFLSGILSGAAGLVNDRANESGMVGFGAQNAGRGRENFFISHERRGAPIRAGPGQLEPQPGERDRGQQGGDLREHAGSRRGPGDRIRKVHD